MNERILWLWLSLCLTPGSESFVKLWRYGGSVEEIFSLDEATYARVLGSSSRDITLLSRHDVSAAERLLAYCERREVGLLPFSSELYPPLLRHIPTAPPLLYYRGQMPDLSAAFPIALVGTRRMSPYGARSTFRIGADLARAGATVVTGMALGIDAVANAAALSVGRPTLAVLGCGIDICYPKEHLTLARAITANGAVLTEYPPGTPPLTYHFPCRNRLIAGMCAATVVFEGPERSGSLGTARHATSFGRTVYALPGNVDAEMSAATALLLKNGARPLTSADDVVRDFEFSYAGILDPFALTEPLSLSMDATLRRLNVGQRATRRRVRAAERQERHTSSPTSESAPERELPPMTGEEAALFSRIPKDEAVLVESLVTEQTPLRTVMQLMLKLQIKGCVELLAGERVRRI